MMTRSTDRISALERARLDYRPRLPALLERSLAEIAIDLGAASESIADREAIRARFPRTYAQPVVRFVARAGGVARRALRVGAVLSGGQAPGGHNVIAGLFDGIVSLEPGSELFGFIGGPRGVFDSVYRPLDGAALLPFRNTGGFDLIGSGRDKIETPAQLDACRRVCADLQLDGLLIIGGDDSNTNAAVLAENFAEHGLQTAVVGVPKTIDGDLKSDAVEISFGFDTATKVYAELVGNIARDARSAGKYWHFVRLMGRAASHVTLECALATRPNLALIGEEVRERGMTLSDVVEQIAQTVTERAAAGRSYGVCLVPEGLIEFIPEVGDLIGALNRLLSGEAAVDRDRLRAGLDARERQLFDALPDRIRDQLLLDRDSHGNLQVSKIDTEALLTTEVARRLERQGSIADKFSVQTHFFGYEGRCAAPSNFDADYAYGLGRVAAALIAARCNGYIGALQNLAANPAEWRPVGIPLTSMMQLESRKGADVPVIAKALVRTDREPFLTFSREREGWKHEDAYRYPGALQYFGPEDVCGVPPHTLRLERGA